MIFYFSGTGNSLAAAKALLSEGEALINMADCVKNRDFAFDLSGEVRTGFVCPVYYGGIPSIVQVFLNHLQITGDPEYTYGVLTCGGMACDAASMLERRLAEAGLAMDAVYPVVMPDNYVLMYSLDSEEKQGEILAKAEEELASIRKNIEEKATAVILAGRTGRLMTRVMYPFYTKGRKTKKFFTTDDCVGCGVCAERCPVDAIEIRDGRPVWVKDRCVQCLACMRCGAVQYGKQTIGRARYTHPALKKKK